MNSLWQVPAVVLTLLVSFAEGPASLGSLSRREMLRRQLTAPAQAALSNDSLPEPPPAAVTGSVEPPPAQEGGIPLTSANISGQPPEAPKDEKWWRERITKVRQALTKDEAALPAAQSRANGLTTQVINMDDPAKQSQLRQQLLTTLAEIERLKAQIESGQKEIAAIQLEARRAGVPPGWIR